MTINLPETIAYVITEITDINDLDNAISFPDFKTAIRAAEELGYEMISQVKMLGPFVLGPTTKNWIKKNETWSKMKPLLCIFHCLDYQMQSNEQIEQQNPDDSRDRHCNHI